MRKIINFDKKLEFPSMIGEITSISLDQELKFKDESNVNGKLIVKGTYKRTEASRLEEEFYFDIPTEIILNEKVDLTTTKIEIDDFFYEIENDDTVNCHINILVEGMEIIEDEEIEDNILRDGKENAEELENHLKEVQNIVYDSDDRECDGDNSYSEEYLPATEEINPKVDDKKIKKDTKDIKEEIKSNVEIKEEEENIQMSKEENIVEEIEENENVGSLFNSFKDSEETFSTYSVYILKEEETIEMVLSKFKITKEELESYNDISNISKGSKLIIPMNHESN